MITKRALLLTILLSVIVFTLSAQMQERFPLGCYSYIRSNSQLFSPHNDYICSQIKDLQYNFTVMETTNDDTDAQVNNLLKTLNKYGLKAIVIDRTYSPNPDDLKHYATYSLTSSNYLKLEAEYKNEKDVHPKDGFANRFWYSSRDISLTMPRIGTSVTDKEASNGKTWKCRMKSDKEGYAYLDARYRWKNRFGSYDKVTKDFFMHRSDKTTQQDSLYIRFRIKLSGFSKRISTNTKLLSFSLKAVKGSSKADTITIRHANLNNKLKAQLGFTTSLTYADYLRMGSPSGYFDYEIRVSYADLYAAEVLTNLNDNYASVSKLDDLNPYLYWHKNCDLALDYIEIEDQLHKDLRTQKDMAPKINERIEYLTKKMEYGNIIKGFYAYDEPKQSQFDSYKIVEKAISPQNPPLMTAIYPNNFRTHSKTANPLSPNLADYYYHQEFFREEVKPLTVLPDPYPILDHTQWNKSPNPQNSHTFVQTMIEERVLTEYKNTKKYVLGASNRKFYPVVQCFGEMTYSSYYKADSWTWMLPPYEMQKCLKYLPLCYAPDGIIDFMIPTQLTNGLGFYSAVNYERTTAKKWDLDNFTHKAIKETNAKTMVYAPMLKTMKWLDADSLRLEKNAKWLKLKPMGLDNLYIVNPHDGPYQGYVQCGLFQDKNNSYSLMLVNRRTNYFIGKSAETTFPKDYPQSYLTAKPQSILFKFSKEAKKLYGTYPACFDPYDSTLYVAEKGLLKVELPAGEGRLLQLVGTLKPKTVGKVHILQKGVLAGDIEICSGSDVVFDSDAELTILPNTKITVKTGASLTIKGNCNFLKNALVINEGQLNLYPNKLSLSQQSGIYLQNGGKINYSSEIRNDILQYILSDKEAELPCPSSSFQCPLDPNKV